MLFLVLCEAPKRQVPTIVLHHADKTQESFEVKHTYNKQQIAWVKAGSALNKIRKDRSAA